MQHHGRLIPFILASAAILLAVACAEDNDKKETIKRDKTRATENRVSKRTTGDTPEDQPKVSRNDKTGKTTPTPTNKLNTSQLWEAGEKKTVKDEDIRKQLDELSSGNLAALSDIPEGKYELKAVVHHLHLNQKDRNFRGLLSVQSKATAQFDKSNVNSAVDVTQKLSGLADDGITLNLPMKISATKTGNDLKIESSESRGFQSAFLAETAKFVFESERTSTMNPISDLLGAKMSSQGIFEGRKLTTGKASFSLRKKAEDQIVVSYEVDKMEKEGYMRLVLLIYNKVVSN